MYIDKLASQIKNDILYRENNLKSFKMKNQNSIHKIKHQIYERGNKYE